jgi:hypothetical protein
MFTILSSPNFFDRILSITPNTKGLVFPPSEDLFAWAKSSEGKNISKRNAILLFIVFPFYSLLPGIVAITTNLY